MGLTRDYTTTGECDRCSATGVVGEVGDFRKGLEVHVRKIGVKEADAEWHLCLCKNCKDLLRDFFDGLAVPAL